jgi:alginate O-acetyltransferase complex protein AlgI
VWGLVHGAWMVAERVGLGRALDAAPAAVGRAYTLLAVTLAWVFFRADDLPQALAYLAALFSPGGDPHGVHALSLYLDPFTATVLVAAMLGSVPWLPALRARLDEERASWATFRFLALNAVFVACAMALASNTHNPFIYFRF